MKRSSGPESCRSAVLFPRFVLSLALGTLLLSPASARNAGQSEKSVEQQEPNLVLPVSQFGERGQAAGQLQKPGSVVFGNDDQVWVCDTGNHRIQLFSLEGKRVSGWGKPGTGPGEFLFPEGLALGPGGEVLVADTGNNRIQVFDSQGSYLRQWGKAGVRPGEFSAPVRLTVAGKTVLVVERENHRVQAFSLEGTPVSLWGGFGEAPGQFREPADISADEDGSVYVADAGNNRIQKFGPEG
jgi:DNA-binding beta-propeller fold protein YncE